MSKGSRVELEFRGYIKNNICNEEYKGDDFIALVL